MSKITRNDWLGLAFVVLACGGMFAFRELTIVPRAMVGTCAAANAPAICTPRHAVLWLQYHQLFGWVAFAMGLAAFTSGRRLAAVLAVAIGVISVINFNATTGIIGAALGLITWAGLCTGRYQTMA